MIPEGAGLVEFPSELASADASRTGTLGRDDAAVHPGIGDAVQP
jgi:hypothetical protein